METKAAQLAVEELRGFAVLAASLARALLEEPGEELVKEVTRSAALLGMEGLACAAPPSRQRYYDRFFVSTSPLYVPLIEGSVRGAAMEQGRWRYASTAGACADHVAACYRALSFDHRCLPGFEPAVRSLKPDSLACELAFMAFLAEAASESEPPDPPAARRAAQLLGQFSREHAARWFSKAADCLKAGDDDFYARVVALAARLAESAA